MIFAGGAEFGQTEYNLRKSAQSADDAGFRLNTQPVWVRYAVEFPKVCPQCDGWFVVLKSDGRL